jgi:hypothetical protein
MTGAAAGGAGLLTRGAPCPILRHMRLPILAALLVLAAAAPAATAAPAAAKAARKPPATAPRFAVPFIEDDPERALALARQRQLPILVETWAPW